MDISTRFWLKVAIRDKSECWEWQAGRSHGYGSFRLGVGKATAAHRFAWEAVNGPIPAGKHVLHHCDNPPCCNPAHLYIGTDVENARDRVERGRAKGPGGPLKVKRAPGWNRKTRPDDRRGHNTPRKFTDEQAERIRAAHTMGLSMRSLAIENGVSHPTIMHVVRRKGVYKEN